MNLQINDTVYMNAENLDKILCKVVKVLPVKDRAIGNNYFANKYYPDTELTGGYILEVVSNKSFKTGIHHKKDSLKGMQYKWWGESLTCSEFIFSQSTFEICLDSDNLPCRYIPGKTTDIKKVVFVKPLKVFSVENTDYFIYKYEDHCFNNGKKSYSYGIAEYMTGVSYVTSQTKGNIEKFIKLAFEKIGLDELIAA